MKRYAQFCPVAMASEILIRRWTLLVVRELLCGSHRFNDLHRGLPRISRTLLSQRLTELEDAGVLERRLLDDGHPEYHLTDAGEELAPIVKAIGVWGKRWAGTPGREELDPSLLLWDMHRRVPHDHLPDSRVVVHFHFTEPRLPQRDFWLLLEPDHVEVCYEDPGMKSDVTVVTDVRTLTDVWMGDCVLAEAMRRNELELRGSPRFRAEFPGWLGLSMFAEEPRLHRVPGTRARDLVKPD